MTKKIFISHSSQNEDVVTKFVDLLEMGIGISGEKDILCTSLAGMGIPAGVNFVDYIKKEINDTEGLKVVILLLSDDYIKSPFCVVELGASWALSHKIIPIIMPSFEENKIKDVLSAVQLLNIDKNSDLNKMQNELTSILDIKGYKFETWERQRNKFMEYIESSKNKNKENANDDYDDQPAHVFTTAELFLELDYKAKNVGTTLHLIGNKSSRLFTDEQFRAALLFGNGCNCELAIKWYISNAAYAFSPKKYEEEMDIYNIVINNKQQLQKSYNMAREMWSKGDPQNITFAKQLKIFHPGMQQHLKDNFDIYLHGTEYFGFPLNETESDLIVLTNDLPGERPSIVCIFMSVYLTSVNAHNEIMKHGRFVNEALPARRWLAIHKQGDLVKFFRKSRESLFKKYIAEECG